MQLMNAKQAAAHIGVSQTTFWRMCRDKPIQTVTVCKRKLYDRRDIEALMSKDRTSAPQG